MMIRGRSSGEDCSKGGPFRSSSFNLFLVSSHPVSLHRWPVGLQIRIVALEDVARNTFSQSFFFPSLALPRGLFHPPLPQLPCGEFNQLRGGGLPLDLHNGSGTRADLMLTATKRTPSVKPVRFPTQIIALAKPI